jgi:Flp pilus assembly protein TadD
MESNRIGGGWASVDKGGSGPKGAPNFDAHSASLKRCPDTKPSLSGYAIRSLSLSLRILSVDFVLMCALTACAFGQTHGTVRHYKERIDNTPPEIAQAEDAIQKNDFSGAEPLLRKAIEKDPNNFQAWFDLGFVLNRRGKSDESIAAYRKSVAAKGDVFESNLNLGLMLVRANRPDAEQFLRAATTLKPTAHVEEGQARAWLALAHLVENKKPEEALQAYRKASELTPKDAEPHLSAGLLLERQKEFPGAEEEYKQVLALDPKSSDAAIGLTNLYMKSGRLGEAEPLLRRLAGERPDDAGLHLQLGRVLMAENKNDDAIVEMQMALKLAPNDSEAAREIADLYASGGKNDLAETAYRTLIVAHPNEAALHRGLGQALLRQKKFPEALQEFGKTVQLKQDWPEAYVDLGFAASENKNYELTVRALNARAKFSAPMPVECYFFRASAYDHLHDYKAASADYHQFLESAKGKYPDQEWQARHRLIAIEPKKR